MTLLNQTERTRFSSDKEVAESSSKYQLEFIIANLRHLDKVRNGQKLKQAAIDMSKQETPLTANQRSFIEGIYEKVWSGANFESVNVHHDKKKSLRY